MKFVFFGKIATYTTGLAVSTSGERCTPCSTESRGAAWVTLEVSAFTGSCKSITTDDSRVADGPPLPGRARPPARTAARVTTHWQPCRALRLPVVTLRLGLARAAPTKLTGTLAQVTELWSSGSESSSVMVTVSVVGPSHTRRYTCTGAAVPRAGAPGQAGPGSGGPGSRPPPSGVPAR